MQDKDQASTILRGNGVEYAAKAAMDGWVIEPDIEGLMCEIASMVELCVQPVEQQGYDMSLIPVLILWCLPPDSNAFVLW